mmetsp:Transcript_10774/g.22925  ORF Transcript_10774/g.22925 Transcript_10774/m.22925 type:complete len:116 (+) Transcript_10774:1289-1636(+)
MTMWMTTKNTVQAAPPRILSLNLLVAHPKRTAPNGYFSVVPNPPLLSLSTRSQSLIDSLALTASEAPAQVQQQQQPSRSCQRLCLALAPSVKPTQHKLPRYRVCLRVCVCGVCVL